MSAEASETGTSMVDNPADLHFDQEYLTMFIDDQIFGIPVLQIQDVLKQQTITKIPLAPDEVAGSLNLRGRIVTAIDLRCKLGMPATEDSEHTSMSVVVEHDNELYSLIIDRVGDVLKLKEDSYEPTPATLDKVWKDIASGIHRLDTALLIVVDVSKLIQTIQAG